MSETHLANRLFSLKALIAQAAQQASRSPASVRLTAVSKTQPNLPIEAALTCGLRIFGENRVQEAYTRWQARKPCFPDLELRLIGPLQTNKARDAVGLFDAVETLDRPRLARAIADASAHHGRQPELYVQVNIGNEPQKAGVSIQEADTFIENVSREYGLSVAGLMCIPPAADNPGTYFSALAEIAARNGISELSMGMSDDFEVAIAKGATRVRVGSLLFGDRPT